jgi:hypothetical protein
LTKILYRCIIFKGEFLGPEESLYSKGYALQKYKKEVEGMPTTEGIGLLCRKNPLSDEEWYRLIEARRSLIKPHLDSFTLRELGEVKCLEQEGPNRLHSLQVGFLPEVVTGDERFSLRTQGIFYHPWSGDQKIPVDYRPSPSEEARLYPGGIKYIWGLTRKGLWILAEVKFRHEAGYKGRGYERALTVDIQELDLPTIVARTRSKPEEIWRVLGEAIKEYTRFRERLYYEALELRRVIEVEELMLSCIPGMDYIPVP